MKKINKKKNTFQFLSQSSVIICPVKCELTSVLGTRSSMLTDSAGSDSTLLFSGPLCCPCASFKPLTGAGGLELACYTYKAT